MRGAVTLTKSCSISDLFSRARATHMRRPRNYNLITRPVPRLDSLRQLRDAPTKALFQGFFP